MGFCPTASQAPAPTAVAGLRARARGESRPGTRDSSWESPCQARVTQVLLHAPCTAEFEGGRKEEGRLIRGGLQRGVEWWTDLHPDPLVPRP